MNVYLTFKNKEELLAKYKHGDKFTAVQRGGKIIKGTIINIHAGTIVYKPYYSRGESLALIDTLFFRV